MSSVPARHVESWVAEIQHSRFRQVCITASRPNYASSCLNSGAHRLCLRHHREGAHTNQCTQVLACVCVLGVLPKRIALHMARKINILVGWPVAEQSQLNHQHPTTVDRTSSCTAGGRTTVSGAAGAAACAAAADLNGAAFSSGPAAAAAAFAAPSRRLSGCNGPSCGCGLTGSPAANWWLRSTCSRSAASPAGPAGAPAAPITSSARFACCAAGLSAAGSGGTSAGAWTGARRAPADMPDSMANGDLDGDTPCIDGQQSLERLVAGGRQRWRRWRQLRGGGLLQASQPPGRCTLMSPSASATHQPGARASLRDKLLELLLVVLHACALVSQWNWTCRGRRAAKTREAVAVAPPVQLPATHMTPLPHAAVGTSLLSLHCRVNKVHAGIFDHTNVTVHSFPHAYHAGTQLPAFDM